MTHETRTRRKLPFDADEALAHLKKNDPKLGALIDRVGEFNLRLDASPSPFETLLESILYQQLHGKAAATIHRRVREFFGGDPTPQQMLDVPDERLRGCGVSGNKIKAMKDLAAKTLDGTSNERLVVGHGMSLLSASFIFIPVTSRTDFASRWCPRAPGSSTAWRPDNRPAPRFAAHT